MAQQGKEKTISSVSDILGFVLEQSELPPEKRTPVRPPETSELQAQSEYVSALVDALALPGTFVGDETLKTIQGLVDPETKIQTFDDRIGNVKLKASDIPAFLQNPDEFVDKRFESRKNLAKMEKLQWGGEQMKMLAGSTYAKKMGLFDNYSKEMKSIMERAVGQASKQSKQQTDKVWVAQASEKILKEGYLNKKIQRLNQKLQSPNLSPAERNQITKEIDSIMTDYKYALNVPERDEEGKVKKYGEGKGITPSFRNLLEKEMRAYQEELLAGRNVEDLSKEEFDEYSKAQEASNMVRLWNKYQQTGKIDRQIKERKEELNEQRQAIAKGDVITINGRKIDYSQLSSAERSEAIREIRKQMRDINSANRSLQRMKFWSGVGKAEGTYYGIKNTLSAGSLEALLNGDFYDPKKGYGGCPSKEGDIELNGVKIKFMKADNEKEDGTEKSRLIQNYNNAMVNLYYMNPVNIMKSLTNGEFFAWRANQIQEELQSMWGVSAGDFVHLKDPKFWSFYKKFKKLDAEGQAKLLASPEYTQYGKLMGRIGKFLGDKDSELGKKLLKAEQLAARFARYGNLAKIFNTPKRLLNQLQDNTIGKIQEGVRDRVVGFLSKLKMFSGNEGAQALLNAWGAGAGGKALSGAISSAVVGALGLAGSAVAGPLGLAISAAASKVLEKVTKLSIKVFIFAFFGVFGLFVLIIGGIGSGKKQSNVDAYSREIPGSVYYNYEDSFDYGNTDFDNEIDGEYHDPLNPDDNWDGDGSGPDTPNECVQGEDLQDVYKRARDFVSSTYGNVTASMYYTYPGEYWYEYGEDWWWCVSTTSGIHCRADKITTGSCSYVYNLFVHELIHQLQGSSCSKYMKEWGADYLSQNAGGYRFSTSKGCIRATELPTNSCSPQEKIDAALCKNTSNSCFQDISNHMSGFCD